MTNLTEKFDSVLDLLIAQNTATQNALANIQLTLDAIATAIGAPPPGGATLQDVVDELQLIRSDLNTFSTDMHNLVTVTNDRLGTIAITAENTFFQGLDLQNVILATACPCDNDMPPLPEPPADFPQPEEGLYCQRIQYMLDQLKIELTDLAQAKASGPVSSTIVNEILSERAAINSVDTPSNASVSGVVSGLNSATGGIVAAFDALRTDLMFAIFEQTTTAGAKEAYDSIVTGAEGTTGPLFRNIGYQGWFNALFDDTVVIWPVSSYDNGACAEPPPLAGEYDYGNGVAAAPWHAPFYNVFWNDYPVLPVVDGNTNLDIAALIAAGVTELQFTIVASSGGSGGQIQVYDSPTDPSPAAFNLPTTYTLVSGDYCVQLYAISGLNAHVRMTVI